MALYPIVFLPDGRLRQTTQVITNFDAKLHKLIDDMYETMYHENGIGLAAPQIGIALKLAVIDVSNEKNQKFCIINPEIIRAEGKELMDGGCLSVPGAYDKVPRATNVTVRAQDKDGKVFELEADGLLAHCLQHEIDHLNGKLFIDYLSPLKKDMARKRMAKYIKRITEKR